MNIHSEFRRAKRIAAMEISEIVQLSERAAALRAAGQDVVSLSTGEPDFPTPDGDFYVFPDISGAIKLGGYSSGADLCSALLSKAGVAIVPGRAFGLPNHARLSFAYSDSELDAGPTRMSAYMKGN